MLHYKIALSKTGLYKPLINHYLDGHRATKPLFEFSQDIDGLKKAVEARKEYPINRTALVNALKKQYEKDAVDLSIPVSNSIDLLEKENTFTITTGHQLNLFGGPAYMIYKMLEVIKMASELESQIHNMKLVPVFWMATEDHDFDEINHCYVNGKKFEWLRENAGAVGDLDLNGIEKPLKLLAEQLSLEPITGSELKSIFQKAYSSKSLAAATRAWVNEVFKNFGLIIIDGNDKTLKSYFTKTAIKELQQQTTFKEVEKTNDYLNQNGYHQQVHTRGVNLFYLMPNQRQRIEKTSQGYLLVDDDMFIEAGEFENEIQEYPERISPNALMRPMYQESILPNLCYVGGAGEIGYWLQLKNAFKAHGIFFPQLVVRNSVVYVSERRIKKYQKLRLPVEHLLLKLGEQENKYATNQIAYQELESQLSKLENLNKELAAMANLQFQELKIQVGIFAAEEKKRLQKLRQKSRKAIKMKNEKDIGLLTELFAEIQPESTLQERRESFITYYLNQGKNLLTNLYQTQEPYANCLYIMS